MDQGHFVFFNPSCPWSAKQLYGLLTNVKLKQSHCESDGDTRYIQKNNFYFSSIYNLHKRQVVLLTFFTKTCGSAM